MVLKGLSIYLSYESTEFIALFIYIIVAGETLLNNIKSFYAAILKTSKFNFLCLLCSPLQKHLNHWSIFNMFLRLSNIGMQMYKATSAIVNFSESISKELITANEDNHKDTSINTKQT